MKNLTQLFLLITLFTSCARTYHTISPALYNFDNKKSLTENINVSYMHDVQQLNDNKPYARKERKKDIKLVAIKVENLSDTTITLTSSNFFIKTGSGRDIPIISPNEYTKKIRQYSETFILFYGLAGAGIIAEETPEGDVNTKFYYNPIPGLIGLGNAIFAATSNSKQTKNIASNSIFNKPIQPNSSIYGLIPIQDHTYSELNFFYYANSK